MLVPHGAATRFAVGSAMGFSPGNLPVDQHSSSEALPWPTTAALSNCEAAQEALAENVGQMSQDLKKLETPLGELQGSAG